MVKTRYLFFKKINSVFRFNTSSKAVKEETEKMQQLLANKIETRDKIKNAIQKFQDFFQKLTLSVDNQEKNLHEVEAVVFEMNHNGLQTKDVLDKKVLLHAQVLSTLKVLFIDDQEFKSSFINFLKLSLVLENFKTEKKKTEAIGITSELLANYQLFGSVEFEELFGFKNLIHLQAEMTDKTRHTTIHNFLMRNFISKNNSKNDNENNCLTSYDWNSTLRSNSFQVKQRQNNDKNSMAGSSQMRTMMYGVKESINESTRLQSTLNVQKNSFQEESLNKVKFKQKDKKLFGRTFNSKFLESDKKSFIIKKQSFGEKQLKTDSFFQIKRKVNFENESNVKEEVKVEFLRTEANSSKISKRRSTNGNQIEQSLNQNPEKRSKCEENDLFQFSEKKDLTEFINKTEKLFLVFFVNEIIVQIFLQISEKSLILTIDNFQKRHNELKWSVEQSYKSYIFYKNLFDQKRVFYLTLLENKELFLKGVFSKSQSGLLTDEKQSEIPFQFIVQKKNKIEKKVEEMKKKAISKQDFLQNLLLYSQNLKSANKMDTQFKFINQVTIEGFFKSKRSDQFKAIQNAEEEFSGYKISIDLTKVLKKEELTKKVKKIQNYIFDQLPFYRFFWTDIFNKTDVTRLLVDFEYISKEICEYMFNKIKKGLYLYYLKVFYLNSFLKSNRHFLTHQNDEIKTSFQQLLIEKMKKNKKSNIENPNLISKIKNNNKNEISKDKKISQIHRLSITDEMKEERVFPELRFLKNNEEDNHFVKSFFEHSRSKQIKNLNFSLIRKKQNSTTFQRKDEFSEINQTINQNYKIIQLLKKGRFNRSSALFEKKEDYD